MPAERIYFEVKHFLYPNLRHKFDEKVFPGSQVFLLHVDVYFSGYKFKGSTFWKWCSLRSMNLCRWIEIGKVFTLRLTLIENLWNGWAVFLAIWNLKSTWETVKKYRHLAKYRVPIEHLLFWRARSGFVVCDPYFLQSTSSRQLREGI